MNKTNRRGFFRIAGGLSVASLFLQAPELFAEQLTNTPDQTEGPYYPITLPLDTDNDLITINSSLTAAIGQITYISGRILSPAGEPIRNAYMEIWHADNSGAYIHPSSVGYATRDLNFQGFGRFMTGSSGEYLFRTIRPGLYTGRTRHIHFKVKAAGLPTLTSQLYFLGEPQNASDSVLNGIRDAQARSSVVVPFIPIEGSSIGALAARFDVVLSATQSNLPVMTITNTTAPSRAYFRPGDNWRLDIRDATAGLPVSLHLWKNNVDLGVSGLYGGPTDADGAWALTGSFGSGDAGLWQLQAVIGGSEVTAPVDVRIVSA